jgi:hypothetical protein
VASRAAPDIASTVSATREASPMTSHLPKTNRVKPQAIGPVEWPAAENDLAQRPRAPTARLKINPMASNEIIYFITIYFK